MSKKVGIALGSGSLKGFAHIGVLQVFQENSIPIDMVAGTSAGAIIGSIFAAGTDLYMLAKYVQNLSRKEIVDMCGPRSGGVLRGNRIQEMVRIFTHDKDFSQTRIPFSCVAVDVETGEKVVLKEGKMHQSVRASMSIPGVFVPVKIGERWCVDGGLLERVPCKTLREMGADVVIGVDVGYCGQVNRIKTPSVRTILGNALDIMQWEIAKSSVDAADIMLYPNVLYMNNLSMERVGECIEEGRRAAQDALVDILHLLDEQGIALKG